MQNFMLLYRITLTCLINLLVKVFEFCNMLK